MLKIFGLLVMSGKEEDMMAMIWAQQIMLGKKTFAQVPRLLKEKVREVLIDSGCEDLVTERRKGTIAALHRFLMGGMWH